MKNEIKNEIKKVALLLVLLLSVTAIIAVAEEVENANESEMEEKELKAKAMEVRYEIVTSGYEKTLAIMEATINYIASKGKNVSVLEQLKSNFTDTYNKLSVNMTPSEFGKTVAEMHKIAAKFKEEVTKLVNVGELKKAINFTAIMQSERINKSAERLQEKKKRYLEKICSVNEKRIQKIIQIAEKLNVSVENITEKLNELKGACEESRVRAQIGRMKDVLDEIKSNAERIILRINERQIERLQKLAEKLEEKGINASRIRERLEIANQIRTEAVSCIENCTEKIRNLTIQVRETQRAGIGIKERKGR